MGDRRADRQQAELFQLAVAMPVVVVPGFFELRAGGGQNLRGHQAAPPSRPGGGTPDGAAEELYEEGVALALPDQIGQRILADRDALVFKRAPEGLGGGFPGQPSDPHLLRPVPERCAHRGQMGLQVRRAGQDQQARQFRSHFLRGVQKRGADLKVKRVRFIHDHHEGIRSSPDGKNVAGWRGRRGPGLP